MPQTATSIDEPAAWRHALMLLGLALILPTLALALPASAEALISTGGGGWFWQNPLPMGSSVDIEFSSPSDGWVIGRSGDTLHTSDGGATWTQIQVPPDFLSAVDFVSADRGWILGLNGLYRTLDGGVHWSKTYINDSRRYPSPSISADINDICFADDDHGWAVGAICDDVTSIWSSAIFRTTDGGTSWDRQAFPGGKTLVAVQFVDSENGWAVGFGGTILATSDGGVNWQAQSSGTDFTLTHVSFVDALHGWCGGYYSPGDFIPSPKGIVLVTADGGQSWQVQRDPSTTEAVLMVAFASRTHGWVTTEGGLSRTTDGGQTWSSQTLPNARVRGLAQMVFPSDGSYWACDTVGGIYHSADGGDAWTGPPPTHATWFRSVSFVSAAQGWAVGYGPTVRTADGGRTWTAAEGGAWRYLEAVDFVDALNGWAVGPRGVVLRTSDGGTSWVPQTSGADCELNGVCFVTSRDGWGVGGTSSASTVLHTSDGGVTWSSQNVPSARMLWGVTFTDVDHGWTVGDYGTVIHTVDGGRTWVQQQPGVSWFVKSISAMDAETAWAVGGGGAVLHTEDAGAHWESQPVGRAGWGGFSVVDFVDKDHGFLAGSCGYWARTTDGGVSWVCGAQLAPEIDGMDFVDAEHGWMAGWDGAILVTSNGGLPIPTLASFDPASGPVGSAVTLTGTGLTGASAVAFNGASATTFTVVSDTQITAAVPAGATTGPITVTSPGGSGSGAASFTVTAAAKPSITKLSPASAARGALVIIKGLDFGTVRGECAVQFGSATCTAYASWRDTQIKCKVPMTAKLGTVNVTVMTFAGTSNAVSFTVKR